eukprot:TRINITY_DN14567_c0_g1_i1.p1 TRINITY_DN14567_c0_g1~~TRINITY_DN14567_c0_g1_i1.p1  ORF type:complete len:440 (+),score=107.80 TRINITY_DN14567_c0_g1_i1:87-1322(+)
MPKHGFLTPKAIANRIKAKGRQKLRWYCQMCEKQCRDANGFKCHCESEGHQRQMLLFGQRQDQFMDEFSRKFERDFMDLVRRRWKTKRVQANVVYNEYIGDRDHLHMNATQWSTLTEFIKHLGTSGQCQVDETEKGWFVKYIDRDPEAIARQKSLEKKERMDVDDETRDQQYIQKLQSAAAQEQGDVQTSATSATLELPESNRQKLCISLDSGKKEEDATAQASKAGVGKIINVLGDVFGEDVAPELSAPSSERSTPAVGTKRPLSFNPSTSTSREKRRKIEAPESLSSSADVTKERSWLRKGIIVRVMNKKLAGGEFYKKKGRVIKALSEDGAEVEMTKCGSVLRVGVGDLETVIPNVEGTVMILEGRHTGKVGLVKKIDTKRMRVTALLEDATLADLHFDAVSKCSPAQ